MGMLGLQKTGLQELGWIRELHPRTGGASRGEDG